MDFPIKNKWLEVSKRLNQEEQIIFLKDSLALHNKNPNNYVLIYIASAFVISYLASNNLIFASKVLFIFCYSHLAYMSLTYFNAVSDFRKKYYKKK